MKSSKQIQKEIMQSYLWNAKELIKEIEIKINKDNFNHAFNQVNEVQNQLNKLKVILN